MRRTPLTRDERGLTLLETLVTVAIIGLILLPVMTIWTQGNRTEATASRQFTQQEKAFKVLREIVDGVDRGSATVPGLRRATEIELDVVPGGLAFKVENTIVTYYSTGESLYRKSCEGCDLIPIERSGGTEVLTDVQDFTLDQEDRLITVRLEVRSPSLGTGSSDTGVRLTTKVIARNLP